MGMDKDRILRGERHRAESADIVIAANPLVRDTWEARGYHPYLIPFGCDDRLYAEVDKAPLPSDVDLDSPIVGFVGYIGSRIDFDLVQAVADRGHSLLLVGPLHWKFDVSSIDRLLARPNVRWIGYRSFEELPSYQRVIDVGIVPYADTPFNRGSFPLKTLEYLSAGRFCGKRPIFPLSGGWIRTSSPLLQKAQKDSWTRFDSALSVPRTPEIVARRQAFAAEHGWERRATQFAELIDQGAADCDNPSAAWGGMRLFFGGWRLKILAFPHHLEIGGVQTNAVDLATAVRDRFGHETVFCATPGPAAELIAKRGFRLIELPRPRMAPSPTLSYQVLGAARREGADVVHAYDRQQILDAFYGVHLFGRLPMLGTVMSMGVLADLPKSIPMTYGTEALVEGAARQQHAPVWLLEPPVNTNDDGPGIVDPEPFRRQWGLDRDTVSVVVVSRLVSWLKAEGLIQAIDAVRNLAAGSKVRLVIVGGGPLLEELQERATLANQAVGRETVVLTGPMIDPRPAYAAADIVIGMGGSALRGMAFAKPVIVLGEQGFSMILTPDTASLFLRQGFYGTASGQTSELEEQLGALIADETERVRLAEFSRSLVMERFGLDASATALVKMYEDTMSRPTDIGHKLTDGTVTLARHFVTVGTPKGVKTFVRRVSNKPSAADGSSRPV